MAQVVFFVSEIVADVCVTGSCACVSSDVVKGAGIGIGLLLQTVADETQGLAHCVSVFWSSGVGWIRQAALLL